MCHAHIGYGIRSNHSFVFQTNPPPVDSTKGVTDPELPLFSVAAGKQNHVWGIPCGLKGQMSGFVLFNESLQQEKIKNLVSPGRFWNETKYLRFDQISVKVWSDVVFLTLQAPTPQNGQTDSSNSLATPDELFMSVFDHFVGMALRVLKFIWSIFLYFSVSLTCIPKVVP